MNIDSLYGLGVIRAIYSLEVLWKLGFKDNNQRCSVTIFTFMYMNFCQNLEIYKVVFFLFRVTDMIISKQSLIFK